MDYEHVTIKGKKTVRCPNPDCDEEEGCCVCEHTGWIYEYVLDSMQSQAQVEAAGSMSLEGGENSSNDARGKNVTRL